MPPTGAAPTDPDSLVSALSGYGVEVFGAAAGPRSPPDDSIPPQCSANGAATLGSAADLLAACALVAGLPERGHKRGQAARKSPFKEDFHAASGWLSL